MRRTITALLFAAAPRAWGSDLNYPAPPNPFATPGAPPPDGSPPAAGDAVKPRPPPPPGSDDDDPILPGGGGDDDDGPPAPEPDPGRSSFAAPMMSGPPLRPPPRARAVVERPGRLRPTLCLAALSYACYRTRPREAPLLSAIDSHYATWAPLLEGAGYARDEPVLLRDLGLCCTATHSGLLWLGMMGQWLPLVPLATDALAHWRASAGATQLLVGSLAIGYLVRKLLPRGAVERHLSVSLDAVRRGRLHTLLTSAFSPAGIVHLLHCVVVLLVCVPQLPNSMGRNGVLGAYAASGAAAAAAAGVTQLIFGRRAQPRTVASAAVMGLLLMRIAADPTSPLDIGGVWSLPPLRAALAHIALDAASNSLPPPRPLGIEKVRATHREPHATPLRQASAICARAPTR